MKRLLLIAAILSTMVGCIDKATIVDGKPVLEAGKTYVEYGSFAYIMLDGHEYVLWLRHGGITHSPNCKCQKEKEKK